MRKLLDQALYLAALDRGCVIAIKMCSLILSFFVLHGHDLSTRQSSINILLVMFLNMINMAAIIIRISGLARGVKYSIWLCYRRAMSRLSAMMLLNIIMLMLGSMILLPLFKLFYTLSILPLILLPLSLLVAFGVIASCFVVDHEFNAIKAIRFTIAIAKEKMSFQSISSLSFVYLIYLSILALAFISTPNIYLPIISQAWILICHIMAIGLYVAVTTTQQFTPDNNTKVMVA